MRLKIIERDKEREYRLEDFNKDIIGFGRQPDSDILLKSAYVSRLHGCIYKENESWYIKDLDSSYGLIFNKKKISSMRLVGGEHIRIKSVNGEYVELIFQPDNANDSINTNVISQQNNVSYPDNMNFQNNIIPEVMPQQYPKKKSKKGAIIVISIIIILAIAASVTAVVLIKGKKDYKAEAPKTTANLIQDYLCYDNKDMINSLSDEDFQEIYDNLLESGIPIEYNDGKAIKSDLISKYDYDGYDEDIQEAKNYISEKSPLNFTLEFEGEYVEVNIGEAEQITKVNTKELKDALMITDPDAEFSDEENRFIDEAITVFSSKAEKSKYLYRVPVKINLSLEEYTGTMDFYDIVYVEDKECKSLLLKTILTLNIYYSEVRYISKSDKTSDVSSAKAIKTAVETLLSDENAYAYLTDTYDFSYIYFIPDGTDASYILLDVPYQHNYDDYISDPDIEGTIRTEIFDNLEGAVPTLKCQSDLDDSIGTPICYVAAISNRGSVSVFTSTVESGFYCDSDGNAYMGYQLCPEIDINYQ